MKNISRKCGICGCYKCRDDYFICYTCINGDEKEKKYPRKIWEAPNSMSYIETKFIENIESLSEEKKEELRKLLSK